jgi:hypothetical protein
LHHCHAALTGSLAQQPYPAALPGSLALQPCPVALPGSPAQQFFPAALLGSLGRQPCRNITNLMAGRIASFFTAVGRHAALHTFTASPAINKDAGKD